MAAGRRKHLSLIKKPMIQTLCFFKGYLGWKADKMQLILICNTLGSGECSTEADMGYL